MRPGRGKRSTTWAPNNHADTQELWQYLHFFLSLSLFPQSSFCVNITASFTLSRCSPKRYLPGALLTRCRAKALFCLKSFHIKKSWRQMIKLSCNYWLTAWLRLFWIGRLNNSVPHRASVWPSSSANSTKQYFMLTGTMLKLKLDNQTALMPGAAGLLQITNSGFWRNKVKLTYWDFAGKTVKTFFPPGNSISAGCSPWLMACNEAISNFRIKRAC